MKIRTTGIVILLFTAAGGRQFYVDTNHPQARDTNAGTEAAPWKTIGKAASTLAAGDTVLVKAGTYNENISPQNSGTAANMITYRRYGTDAVVITGGGFNIQKNYIRVQGFEISGGCIMFGFQAAGGSHCQILDNYIHHNGTCGMFIHGSYNLIRGNKISSNGSSWGDQITTGWGTGSDHIVFEYNEVSDPQGQGEDFLQYLGHDFIARGNHFHDNLDNGRHNDFYQSGGGEYNIWMVGNLIEDFHGQIYMTGSGDHDHIWRSNTFWGYIGWGFNGAPAGMRVAGNTFGSAGGGYGYSGSGLSRNNIYNDWGTQECPYGADDGDYNLVFPAPSSSRCTHGTHDQWGKDPKFVNAAGHDYHLQSSSPAINAGTYLTTTTGAGSGTQIPMADAKLFIDGFGIADGDSIQLEGQTQVAKILSINYSTNVLTVDQALTWTNGLGVSLPYSGAAPDIGALEYGLAAISRPETFDARHHPAGAVVYPQPVRAAILDRILRESAGLTVRDLTGRTLEAKRLAPGVYLVQHAEYTVLQKIVVVP